MYSLFKTIKNPLLSFAAVFIVGFPQLGFSCGGLFCDTVPINQAGEQIVFRQEGDETVAMIKIDYVGNAADFGWVLPVPTTPEISLGSDQIFTELELNTRPQFILSNEGTACPSASSSSSNSSSSSSSSSNSSSSSSSGSVFIEQELSVGAFDAKIISSDDASSLASWLADNDLDLSEQGSDLLAPYIQARSKFVVLKLKNRANIGSIQPVILRYKSSVPVIPMTLTAVAAQDDMGVLVWLLGDGRGVPHKDFKHIIPNYTRLNWFSGNRSAYLSYQNLITEAANEAGGQAFATDFAGYMPSLVNQFSTPQQWHELLPILASSTDANFIALVWNELNPVLQSTIMRELPTSGSFVYQNPLELAEVFTPEQLTEARVVVLKAIQEQVIAPLEESIALFDSDLYLTRLYTTLSAKEMDKNPEFTFNPNMAPQPLIRNATLSVSCIDEHNRWALKLGEGTGREDELVVESWDDFIPFNAASTQEANWRVQKTSANADPVVIDKNNFSMLSFGVKQKSKDINTSAGSSDDWLLFISGLMFVFMGSVSLYCGRKPK